MFLQISLQTHQGILALLCCNQTYAYCVSLNVELGSLDKVAIIIKKVMGNARLWQIYSHIGLNKSKNLHRQYQ